MDKIESWSRRIFDALVNCAYETQVAFLTKLREKTRRNEGIRQVYVGVGCLAQSLTCGRLYKAVRAVERTYYRAVPSFSAPVNQTIDLYAYCNYYNKDQTSRK